jgi:hypothetical protein
MGKNYTCQAKDPDTCWKHGNKQGLVALKSIKNAVAKPTGRYYLSEEQRKVAPLKNLTATGLTLAILDYSKNAKNVDMLRVQNAILLASHLHREDTRANRGRYTKTPYIEHPLRNTLRAIRYGDTSESVIIGSILHDTVEDHPYEISKEFYGAEAKTEHEARANSLAYIKNAYGTKIRNMVSGMSNPITENKYTLAAIKNKAYADHVREAIEDPDVCVGKVCDFVDNAVGLYHNQGGLGKISTQKKARKYLPVCDILIARLERARNEEDFPASHVGIGLMIKQLKSGKEKLIELLAD